MKVLIVSSGCYSSWSIVAIYSEGNRKIAEALADMIEDANDIEEWEVDPELPEDPGLDCFSVEIAKSGDVVQCRKESRLTGDLERWEEHVQLRTYKDSKYERKSYWRLWCQKYAKSEEHVIRHVNELRRQILAGQRPSGVDYGKN